MGRKDFENIYTCSLSILETLESQLLRVGIHWCRTVSKVRGVSVLLEGVDKLDEDVFVHNGFCKLLAVASQPAECQ